MGVMKSWPSVTAVSVACGLYAAPTWPLAAQERPPGARPVQIVYCSDVRCSTGEEGVADAPSIQLESRYTEHAGAILRVVVVSEHDKSSALIDMTVDVKPDGAFDVLIPIRELPPGVYDISVMAEARFVAEGRFKLAQTTPVRRR
ncbi:hypothetical protein [uncultured Azohydromonas sp.]|jgi:hypothetical protein|uniref:hypothetical protein n=1 Tax=uncultured Azohydromonas sp. TaxID=487342 RepID=UPI00261F5CBD|nr:hypothetical protein [uncultured Azohydromonas sp.]